MPWETVMPGPSPAHLLVVDDDAGVREALAVALSDTYRVHTASNEAEALALLRQYPVAAIILDAMLGDEDGLVLIEPFRSLSAAPILILTGHSTETLAIRALWAKADGYLRKPVDGKLLRLTLTRMLAMAPPRLDPVEQARRHLDKHIEGRHTNQSVAGVTGLSERQLRRRFHEVHGMTPRRYLTETRLGAAADLLKNTALGIEQIARDVGYPSLASFDRSFKRFYGMTPTEFRSQEAAEPQPGSTSDSAPQDRK